MYDSTIKSLGFDEIRVRYRQQRRSILHDVIVDQLSGTAMEEYITLQTSRLVPEKDREAFRGDVVEDLREIDQNRIVGLGITPEQLKNWLKIDRT